MQQICSIWKLYRSCSKLQQMQISSLHIGSELMSFAIPPWKSMMIHWFPLMRSNQKKIVAFIHLRNAFFPHVKLYLAFLQGCRNAELALNTFSILTQSQPHRKFKEETSNSPLFLSLRIDWDNHCHKDDERATQKVFWKSFQLSRKPMAVIGKQVR